MTEPEDFVVCRVCGGMFKSITARHLQKHSMSMLEYHQQYPDAPVVCVTTCAKHKGRGCFKKGNIPWNTGLTKETDNRLVKLGQKSSETKKKRFSTGQTVPWTKGKRFTTQHKLNMSKAHKGKEFSLEHRRAISEGLKGRIFSEEHKKKLSAANIGRKFTSEWRQKLSENNAMRRPEISKKVSLANTGRVQSQEEKDKRAESCRIYWTNISEEELIAFAKRVKKGTISKPNTEEKRVLEYVSKLGFKYTGDYSKIIPIDGGSFRVPDFVHKTERIIIEYDGFAGHTTCLSWIPNNKPELDNKRNEEYKQLGYIVIIITPEDLSKGEEHIRTLFPKWFMDARRLVT